MIKKLKQFLTTLSLATLFVVPALPLASVATVQAAEIQEGLNCGAELDATGIGSGTSQCADTIEDPSGDVDRIVKLVINIFSVIVGVVSVIMIIVGGLKYITSSGDSGNITGAKNTILYAIVGLIFVALAQIIVKFVLQKAVGAEE